ncbi:MAG: phosphatase PAP2 family protein [Bacteroidetes bacterium]|nr:phosphatase PAP2 family protein [Bacteroidota bacterium]
MNPTNYFEKFSKIFSAIFNPIFSLLFYFIFQFWMDEKKENFSQTFIPILLLLVLPIIFWIAWNVRKGKYSDSDVSNQSQRNSLYFFINPLLLVYILWLYLMENRLDFPILFLFVLFVLMMVSNFFIKSSMHTAFNLFAAALFFKISIPMGILWLGITIIVAITRIVLKRHSVSEILSGSLISLVVSFLYLYSEKI